MPVLKISQGRSSSAMIGYLLKQNQNGDRVQMVGGNVVGRDSSTIEKEFKETRNCFGQNDGRQYYHVALSFERQDLGDLAKPDGSPDFARIRDYGEEWAKEAGIADRHDCLVVVHGEKAHPHAHVVWNATGLDGRKYNSDSRNIDRLRDVNDRVARNHGIQRELDRVRDPHRPSDKFIRQVERGGDRYSWRMDLQDRIREAGRRAFSEEEFKARLKARGVDLRIRGEKYSYAMKDDRGKYRVAREGRLGEGYHREHLAEKFAKQKDQLRLDPEGYRQRLKKEQSERYIWQRDLRGRITDALKISKSHEGFQAALKRQGVQATLDKYGRYRFEFKDGHGLPHAGVPAERLWRGTSERISNRLQENAARSDLMERAGSGRLAHVAGHETKGLVASLMREMESSGHEPRGRAADGPPTREEMRDERPRRRDGQEIMDEQW